MKRLVLLAGVAALTGCTVGPNYKPPPPLDVQHWNDLAKASDDAVSEASDPDPRWWDQFHDPLLTALMNQAIASNPSLQQAVLRVVESHQNEITAASAGLPSLSANGSYMREELGLKGILESQGAYADLNELANASTPLNIAPGLPTQIADAGKGGLDALSQPVNLFQYGLSASWEIDLFGQVRRSVEEAKATTAAESEAANDALVMLESEVAQEYFALRAAQAEQAQQEQSVEIARNSLQLTQSQQLSGLGSDIDVEQARTQLLGEQAQLETFQKQEQQAVDEINTLLGLTPGTLDARLDAPAPMPSIPAVVGVGVPSDLARRRPDIREAEDELHAATANIGVATAAFYPSLSLTGSLGLRALDASYLTNWASHFYSAGPSVSLPIFEGGKLEADLKMAKAAQVAAALDYRGTVLNALREVEDALVAYRTDQAARDDDAATVQAAGLAYYLANNRYAHGLSSYLQALSAEQTLMADEQQLVQANAQLATDVVTLYTALGGGWQDTALKAPASAAPPPPVPAALDSMATR